MNEVQILVYNEPDEGVPPKERVNFRCFCGEGTMVFGRYTAIAYWDKYPGSRFEVNVPGWSCNRCGNKIFMQATGDLIDLAIVETMEQSSNLLPSGADTSVE